MCCWYRRVVRSVHSVFRMLLYILCIWAGLEQAWLYSVTEALILVNTDGSGACQAVSTFQTGREVEWGSSAFRNGISPLVSLVIGQTLRPNIDPPFCPASEKLQPHWPATSHHRPPQRFLSRSIARHSTVGQRASDTDAGLHLRCAFSLSKAPSLCMAL